jgi:hypothetical protein
LVNVGVEPEDALLRLAREWVTVGDDRWTHTPLHVLREELARAS